MRRIKAIRKLSPLTKLLLTKLLWMVSLLSIILVLLAGPGYVQAIVIDGVVEERPLDDVLIITISRGEEKLFQGTLGELEELDLGSLGGDQEQKIDIEIFLPGAKTGNEDQDIRFTVGLRLLTDCSGDDLDIVLEEPAVDPGSDENGDDSDDDEILVDSEEPGVQPTNGTNIIFQCVLLLMLFLIGIKVMDKRYN